MKGALVLFGLFVLMIAISAHSDRSVTVTNNGQYTAKFTIFYELNGQKESKTSGDIQPGAKKSVQFPDEAKTISVKCELYQTKQKTNTVFTADLAEGAGVQICYKISGTTFNPTHNIISC